MSYTQKIVKKSAYWHRHGKHAKVDPFYYQNERKHPRATTSWFASVRDAFADAKKKRL